MKETITNALKGFAEFFNVYAGMMGVLAVAFLVQRMNEVFKLEQEELQIFSYKIYEEYFSLIYAVLFGFVLVLLFLKVRLLYSASQTIEKRHIDKPLEFVLSIKYFPWVASPLQRGIGPFLYWSIIGAGLVLLAEVAYAHAIHPPGKSMPDAFVYIGYFAATVFCGGLVIIRFMAKHLHEIQVRLDQLQQGAAEQQREPDA